MTRHKPRVRRMVNAVEVVALFITAWSVLSLQANGQPPLAKSPLTAEQAQNLQRQWAKHIGQDLVHTNSIGMKLMLLPPGEFTMGRTEEQLDRLVDLTKKQKRNIGGQITWSMLMMPAHRVRITKPFYVGATEVTVGQFRQFCDASGYKTEAEQGLDGGVPYKGKRPICTWRKPMVWINLKQKEDEPVLHLCWNDCVEFCKWLSKKEGVEYCLPTEAEWEYACRAGTTTPWSFGDWEDVPRVAHEYAYWSEGTQGKHDRPRSVAKGKPNAFGLYDMHGNVWEYVADWWHEMSYKESPLNDPTGPEVQHERGDMRRIIRGSSYDWDSWGGDSAYRMRITQRSSQHPHQGFRVALRIKGAQGVPPAVDPKDELRKKKRDPGADSPEVKAALKASAAIKRPKELVIDLDRGVKMEFVLIPAGSFLMGSQKGPKDEGPVHRVVISKPFYMAKFPVTQAQWQAVVGKQGRLKELEGLWERSPDAIGPNKVMVGLNWNDSQDFARKLKAKAPDHAVALPSEAQWEYACRAGADSEFSFGDDEKSLGEHAWFAGNMIWPGVRGHTRATYPDVGQKKPNRWGLYDIHGGVWQWCADWYDPDYYLTSPMVDPRGPETGRFKVVRGGSWFRHGKFARSAYRRFFHADEVDYVTAYIQDFGCRVVINLGEDKAPAKADGKVNYTKMARSLVCHPHNPVIKLGEKGAWNDQTLGCFTLLDRGDKFFLYSGGARFGKPTNVGMATSKDGINWTYYEKNPLFPGSMPHVLKVGNILRLYNPVVGELQMRTSQDGFKWSDPRKVMEGCLDLCVIRVGENKYHLYFCAGGKRTIDGKEKWEFKNYLATSPDGIAWKKEPGPVLPLGPKGSWDSASHAGPCVLKLADGYHMWYLGSGPYKGKTAWRIGHATSPDGLKWTRLGDEPVLDIGKPGDWDGGTFMHIDVIFRNGKFLFWYAAAPTEHGDETKMKIQIGHGTSK